MSDVPVNVESPEDRERALAIERSEISRLLAAQTTSVQEDIARWLTGIEPSAREYYYASKQAEKALLLSIAISLNRTAGNKPIPSYTKREPRSVGGISRKPSNVWTAEPIVPGSVDDTVGEGRAGRANKRTSKKYGSKYTGRKQPRKHK